MQKTNRRLVLTYVPRDGDPKIFWEDCSWSNYLYRTMPPDIFFKNVGYEAVRMMLGIAEQCARFKKKFDVQHCHWNLLVYQVDDDNEFSFGG